MIEIFYFITPMNVKKLINIQRQEETVRAQHHPSFLLKGRVAKLRHTAKFKQNTEKDGQML